MPLKIKRPFSRKRTIKSKADAKEIYLSYKPQIDKLNQIIQSRNPGAVFALSEFHNAIIDHITRTKSPFIVYNGYSMPIDKFLTAITKEVERMPANEQVSFLQILTQHIKNKNIPATVLPVEEPSIVDAIEATNDLLRRADSLSKITADVLWAMQEDNENKISTKLSKKVNEIKNKLDKVKSQLSKAIEDFQNQPSDWDKIPVITKEELKREQQNLMEINELDKLSEELDKKMKQLDKQIQEKEAKLLAQDEKIDQFATELQEIIAQSNIPDKQRYLRQIKQITEADMADALLDTIHSQKAIIKEKEE